MNYDWPIWEIAVARASACFLSALVIVADEDSHRGDHRIIRGNDYIFRSEEQQHSFNFPVQAGTNSRDTPIKDAQRFNVKVQKDDVSCLPLHVRPLVYSQLWKHYRLSFFVRTGWLIISSTRIFSKK